MSHFDFKFISTCFMFIYVFIKIDVQEECQEHQRKTKAKTKLERGRGGRKSLTHPCRSCVVKSHKIVVWVNWFNGKDIFVWIHCFIIFVYGSLRTIWKRKTRRRMRRPQRPKSGGRRISSYGRQRSPRCGCTEMSVFERTVCINPDIPDVLFGK